MGAIKHAGYNRSTSNRKPVNFFFNGDGFIDRKLKEDGNRQTCDLEPRIRTNKVRRWDAFEEWRSRTKKES